MKKGISPLIATVLIIGLTIVVFSLAMAWQRGLIQNISKGASLKTFECSKVQFNVDSACYLTDSIIIQIQNTVDYEISGFEFRIKGEKSTQFAPTPPFVTYKSGTYQPVNIPYDPNLIGPIEEIEVIPKVRLEGKAYICTDKSKTLIDLPAC